MNHFKVSVLAVLIMLFPGSVSLASDEWSQFRGPNGSGVSATTGLPQEFGPNKNVVWKTELPPGHSSPVLTRDRIFVTAFTKEKDNHKLFVICLDRQTGKILWQREVPRTLEGRLQNVNGPASPSPVTDGSNVYVFFQEFGLISFDRAGKERWKLPLGPFNMFYGFGASPILVDDKVILPVDQDNPSSYLIAVDKNSGRVRWKVDRPVVISGYSTPIIYQPKQGPKQIVVPESFQLSAYSVEDGKRVWWVRGLACEMKSIASHDDEYLYINGWGFPQNQPGQQIPTISFEEGLARYDKNGDKMIAKTEISGTEKVDKMLAAAFEAFDGNRDEKLDERDWEVFRAMMASENGLLAIKMGGEGDQTAKAIRWKYQKPVPQVPSTLLYKGVLYMINDSGILLSFDPATGNVIKQGRLQGAIDKYFSSPVAADDKVYLIGEAGAVSVLKAAGAWEVLAVNELDDEVFATPAIADGHIYIRTRSALYCFGKV
ncbi:MAG TPA: PQQ-binding-like beta-propeller repeat protein [Pyrinomonadaceae bacterium]|jgi:outer membrane protein assembly factor BamB|nr:PQQ-binding-like beta-propeller repeat protein [Pyrinomonadaceae bacterium]